MKRHSILIILILNCLVSSFSQSNLYFENIYSEQGLFNDYIRSIVQDKDGFVWIASNYGLYRYDGYKLTDYSFDQVDKKAFIEPIVNKVFLDRNLNFWVQGDNLNMYDSKTEKFIPYKSQKLIEDIAMDTSGNIWILSEPNRISLFNFKLKKYIPIDNNELTDMKIYGGIICDSDNYLWFLDIQLNSENIYNISLNDFYKTNKIRLNLISTLKLYKLFLYADQNGTIWLFQNGVLKYFDKVKKQFCDFLYLKDNDNFGVTAMFHDSKGRLWLGCDNYEGLRCIYLRSKKTDVIKANVNITNKLYADKITTFFEDSFGLLWVGTGNNGVYKTNLNGKKFDFYNTDQGLPDNNVQSIFEDSKGNRYFGTYKGIAVIQPDSKVQIFNDADNNRPHLVLNSIFTFTELPGGNIVIGGTGLNVVNFKKNDYYYLIPDSTEYSLVDWSVYNIHKGQKSGHYWISGKNGFNEISDFKLEKALPGVIKKLRPDIKLFNERNSGEKIELYWFAYEDKDGIIWLCSSNGLIRYDPVRNKIKHFPPDIDNPNALHVRDVNCCCEDKKGRLWFATLGGGLSEFDRKSEIFHTVTQIDGLPSNLLYGVLDDTKGNLWISSNKGLCKYNPDTRQVRCYDKSDGVQENDFNQHAFYKSTNGKMYFGGRNGVTAFYPDSITENLIPPRIVITKLYINNKPVEAGERVNGDVIINQPLIGSHLIKLSYRQKAFAFEFSGLQFVAPDKIKYQYKMDGYDPDWLSTDAWHRRAHYSNLPAGHYIFKVKACSSEGIWSLKESSVLLEVTPPFFKTWWFWLFITGLSGLTIMTIFRIRVRSIVEQKVILENLVRDRTKEIEEKNIRLEEQKFELTRLNSTKDKFFSIISHDLKNPFHGIMSTTELLTKEFKNMDDVEKLSFIQMIDFSSKSAYGLLDNLLYWARTQTGTIDFRPEIFDLSHIAKQTRDLLLVNAQSKEVMLKNEIPDGFDIYADKNMITTIIRNLMNNAIKFTMPGGSVTISSEQNDKKVSLFISDTGVGIDRSKISELFSIDRKVINPGTAGEKGTGLGLIICNEFVKIHKGTIIAESNPGKGSTFIVELPRNSGTDEFIPTVASIPGLLNSDVQLSRSQKDFDQEANPYAEKVLLIIDDDQTLLKNLKKQFEVDYLVHLAENGTDGFKISVTEIPDLIISDVTMPVMNGFDLCDKLKKDSRTSHIPVILLTANDTDKDRTSGFETGADDYITKPFNAELLKLRVKNLIVNREQLKKIYCKKLISLEPVDVKIKNSIEKKFIDSCIELIEKDLSNPDYSIDSLARDLAMSRAQMYRKFEGLLKTTPNMFIRYYRLKKAAELLLTESLNIKEVCFRTGFVNPDVFRKWFQLQFGINPSSFAKQYKSNGHL